MDLTIRFAEFGKNSTELLNSLTIRKQFADTMMEEVLDLGKRNGLQ